MKIFSNSPQKISCSSAPSRIPYNYHSLLSLFFFFCLFVTEPLLIPSGGINSIIFVDGCHISLLFPTDSVIFIHSFPFMSRQESHLQLFMVSNSPAGLLLFFSYYAFQLFHSSAWSSWEASQCSWDKIKNSHHSSWGPVGSGCCLPPWLHLSLFLPLFTLLGPHGLSLCALDKPTLHASGLLSILFWHSLHLHMADWFHPLYSESFPGPPKKDFFSVIGSRISLITFFITIITM